MKSTLNLSKRKIACVIHAFYTNLLLEVLDDFIKRYGKEVDLYISLPYNVDIEILRKLKKYNCKIFLMENINRDIGPFLKILPELMNYKYCCKISLKKSETEIIGDLWREQILEELFFDKIIDIFENKKIGMLIPDSFALDFKINIASNQKFLEEVCTKLKIKYPKTDTFFSAGSMFWFRPKALKKMINYKVENHYEPLPQDGTELHAIERLLGYVVQISGYEVLKINGLNSKGNKKTFYETLMNKKNIATKSSARLHKTKNDNLVIFVHFNRDNESIDKYVYEYLKSMDCLKADILFISNSKINQKYIDRLLSYVSKIVIRENKGYDFFSYKKGLSLCDYWNYKKVILANDTLIGPFSSFNEGYKKILNSKYNIFGMTASTQFCYHIQSFFITFDKKVTNSESFKEFWSCVQIENNVMDVIMKYELNLSKFFMDRGFSASALFTFSDNENKIMNKPIELINDGFPFLKKKVFNNMKKNDLKKLGIKSEL